MSFEKKCDNPEWLSEKGVINEVLFCEEFVKLYPLKYVDNKFVSVDGVISADTVSRNIANMLMQYVGTSLSRKVKSLTEAMKLYCYDDSVKNSPDEIHISNGFVKPSGEFFPEKKFCISRLDVNYKDECEPPAVFLSFLDDLLESSDIATLQEYLGYCLIPSTKGQAMMFIIGSGGEGKSRLGVLLKSIFGDNMIESKLHRLETDRFARANLQGKLLMIDDDMQLEALSSTGYIKNLVTAETPVDIEIKGQQSFQAEIYARFLCFGNGSPKALYDKTYGFGRRLIILTTKPVPSDRVVDRFIADKMIAEKDMIFKWMLEGLKRLIQNNYCFTLSDKAKQNVSDMMSDNCNIIDFLKDTNSVIFDEERQISSADLHLAYTDWCEINALTPMKRDSFISWLKCNQERYAIRYDCNIKSGGHRVRGFSGLSAIRARYRPYGV